MRKEAETGQNAAMPHHNNVELTQRLVTLDYGLIGNGQINALVSVEGSIDWACMPTFDSPSVFARLLDPKIGGTFRFIPEQIYGTEQQYLKNTVVLETRFLSRKSTFNLIDFAPRFEVTDGIYNPPQIFRLVEVVKGQPEVRIIYEPRFNYSRGETRLFIEGDALVAEHGEERLYLYSNISLQKIMKGESVTLPQGSYFVLSYNEPLYWVCFDMVLDKLNRTTKSWRTWVKHCYLPSRFQTEIIRSALTLKMLVYEKTGAVIAAPTTSIPEIPSGNRTWDYRFCWLRDSYFIVNALMQLSQFEELEGFINYLRTILGPKYADASFDYIRPLYGIDGKPVPEELFLDHLSGYNGGQPVRIGNDATTHFQNDIYGELVQAIYPMFFDQRLVREDLEQLWSFVKRLVEIAIDKFPEEDNGIWEFRNARRHYTFSKLMCWVAVDRGIKIAKRLAYPEVRRWARVRGWMRSDILTQAWNSDLQAFTQAYGSHHLDASTLLMPTVGFIQAKEPRMKSTIRQSEKYLMQNGFVFRYTNKDDFGRPENTFAICTFWLIDALALAGDFKKALYYFENVLRYANHVGLFSEDINPKTGAQTGNFPQGYTHVAIINTAMKLNNHNLYLA